VSLSESVKKSKLHCPVTIIIEKLSGKHKLDLFLLVSIPLRLRLICIFLGLIVLISTTIFAHSLSKSHKKTLAALSQLHRLELENSMEKIEIGRMLAHDIRKPFRIFKRAVESLDSTGTTEEKIATITRTKKLIQKSEVEVITPGKAWGFRCEPLKAVWPLRGV